MSALHLYVYPHATTGRQPRGEGDARGRLGRPRLGHRGGVPSEPPVGPGLGGVEVQCGSERGLEAICPLVDRVGRLEVQVGEADLRSGAGVSKAAVDAVTVESLQHARYPWVHCATRRRAAPRMRRPVAAEEVRKPGGQAMPRSAEFVQPVQQLRGQIRRRHRGPGNCRAGASAPAPIPPAISTDAREFVPEPTCQPGREVRLPDLVVRVQQPRGSERLVGDRRTSEMLRTASGWVAMAPTVRSSCPDRVPSC